MISIQAWCRVLTFYQFVSKYPPAEPGALDDEPLKAAITGRCRGPKILSLRSPAALIEDLTNSHSQWRLLPSPTLPDARGTLRTFRNYTTSSSIAELPLVCLAAHDWKFR